MEDDFEAIEVITYESGELPEERLQEIAALRLRVWQPILEKSSFSRKRGVYKWLDPVDREAIHFAIMDLDDPTKIAAAARLSLHPSLQQLPDDYVHNAFPDWAPEGPLAMFGHLVVDPHDRHHSFGYRLDTLRFSRARQLGAKLAVMVVVPWRVANYERLACDMVGPIPPEVHGYFDQPVYLMTRNLEA